MKTRLLPLLITVLLMGLATVGYAQQTFTLRGVRSSQDYGPFTFRHGGLLKLESGEFKLNILADGRAFTLVDTETGLAYGVYELVLGRMIDIGDVLFIITTISAPPPSMAAQPPAPSFLDDTEFAVELTLLHKTAYDWEINGASGGDHEVERGAAALKVRKGIVTMDLGLTTDAEWDHTIAGDGDSFENAGMDDGTGWFAAVGLRVPVFKEGRWSGIVHGEAFYRREELSLQYGAWEIESITTITDTNAVTNAVVVTENRQYNNYDETATLTETLVSIGIELCYNAPAWSWYAGLRALPWSDTSLDAVIRSDDRRYDITFERKDPIMAYGGIGVTVMGIRTYIEAEGGGETSVRLGLSYAY